MIYKYYKLCISEGFWGFGALALTLYNNLWTYNISLCTEFVQNSSAFFGMLLVVVGYHLMLDGPHALRCVFSNIRCFMQSIHLLADLESPFSRHILAGFCVEESVGSG